MRLPSGVGAIHVIEEPSYRIPVDPIDSRRNRRSIVRGHAPLLSAASLTPSPSSSAQPPHGGVAGSSFPLRDRPEVWHAIDDVEEQSMGAADPSRQE